MVEKGDHKVIELKEEERGLPDLLIFTCFLDLLLILGAMDMLFDMLDRCESPSQGVRVILKNWSSRLY